MDESINTENKEQDRQKPPLSVGRIAGEILAGMAISAAIAYLSLCVVSFWAEIADLGKGCMDFRVLPIMACVVPPMYVLGCTIGVYLVGNIGKQTGSFLLPLAGGFVGAYVVLLPSFGLFASGKVILYLPLLFLLLIPPTITTLCFNLTRRYKKPPSF